VVQVVRRAMPDHEADVRRRPGVRLIEGGADTAQGNELRMALREKTRPARRWRPKRPGPTAIALVSWSHLESEHADALESASR
jgi:hypothetical protein